MIKMDVQDYEYYEARAKDVKLEDITSSQQNADILERLRDNDPDFTYISIDNEHQDDYYNFAVREGDNLGWLGYFLGRSKQVKSLCIENFPDHPNIDAFSKGLGHNRSIQCLYIDVNLGEHFQSFGPFLQNNNNLRDLTFDNSVELDCAHNIALLLGQQSSLKCLNFDEANLGDEEIAEIASVLRKQPQIEELKLSMSNIGRNGCVALGNALEGMRNPDLATLHLLHNDIDDDGLSALAAGLNNCHKLTSLYLSGNELITEVGLRSLSALFQSDDCRLEHLGLYRTNMDNDGAAVLTAGLARLPSLTKLDLSNNRIGDQGLQALAGGLVNCNLEEFNLSSNNMLTQSVIGLRSLGELVQRATRLKLLSLGGNTINDEGLKCLVEGIVNCCSLETLSLSYNDSITAAGLTSLSNFFRSDNCCLKKLWLWGINFGDEGVVALANGLIGNESLIDLRFDLSGITARDWSAFSKLLCDTASVNNTYLSNHTLETIGGFGYGMQEDAPPDIVEYLTLNKLQNCATAICKILKNHPDIDIEALLQWKLKCLPLVVTWLEMARPYRCIVKESTEVFQCRQLSALYKFIRGMPLLAVDGYRGKKMKDIQSMSKKRKLDETL